MVLLQVGYQLLHCLSPESTAVRCRNCACVDGKRGRGEGKGKGGRKRERRKERKEKKREGKTKRKNEYPNQRP